MNRNGKKILCLLAAFMLFFTNSSIMSVFAEEETTSTTDTVQLESAAEPISSPETNSTGNTGLNGKTNSIGNLNPLPEMDSHTGLNSTSQNDIQNGQELDISHNAVTEESRAGAGERTIYYDATLSKVTYSGNDGNLPGKVIRKPNSIPSTTSGSKVYYYAWKSTDSSDSVNGEMTKESSYTQGANTWADVWSVNLDDAYDRIVFASYSVQSSSDYQTGGTCTKELEIPSNLTTPCFYADNGDQCVYEQQWMNGNMITDQKEMRRDGHWKEVHQITTCGNDITSYTASGTETRDSRKLYINTTFFDYYSDKEINGVDRGTIQRPTSNPPVLGYTNRTYMPNKLFNTALSDYYHNNNVDNPLYFGHFQWKYNTEGTYYKSIGDDLNLFGYDDKDKFYHINNSEYRKDHAQCNEDETQNNHTHATDVATQGLVDSSLSSGGELQMSGAKAPFFDKAFLEGANSYNTALGKVYPSVYFPFTKENDYWTFNSKETTLRMTQSPGDNHYFLQEKPSNPVMGYTNGLPTTNSNFFPFDDGDSSGKVNELNYGFGMKMDINFRLTQDGTIKDSSGTTKPITFNFSGDDDIWIFIDGKLALDIGGGHGEVSGELDFSTKTATISKVKTTNGEQTDVTNSFTLKGANTEQHTLTMYYMERGLWESNMYVTFNFPDNNVFSAEKEVDTTGIDSLFANNANFKTNVKNLVFDLDIKNLATHYGSRTVAEMDAQASAAGFIMRQEHIADYGSVASKEAEPANGAKYSLFNKGADDSETLVGTSNGNTVANGVVSLKDKQIARFTNKFRRGSYIVVTEKTSSMMENLSGLSGSAAEKLLTDVFDTKYSIFSKNAEISQENLQADTYWVTGSSLISVKNQSGVAANDGRTEKLVAGATDMNGTTIPHTTGLTKPANAILFRNYINPDSETVDMDLNVKYTNSFKTGVIAITKKQAAGSDTLDPNTNYSFTVTFDNVAGLKLEDTWDASYQATADNKIQQTFTLKLGETKIFTGIPAGTKYTISETAPTDGSVLKSVTDSLASGTAPAGVGKDTVTISSANVVSGTVTADTTTSTVQTFTFNNHKDGVPFIPGNNVFSAEKEVDTTGINPIFTNDTVFKDNIKDLVFDFEIHNLATHYGSQSVEQMELKASTPGAVMYQEDIADYGSVTSGKAEPANGAKFSRYANGTDGSQILVGSVNGNTVANNSFSLKDNQIARFGNKFRRGSYIVLKEKTSSMMKTLSGLSGDAAEQLLTDVFDTSYTVYNKDNAISQADLQKNTTWVTGSSLSSLSNVKGAAINDGRREKSSAGATDGNGTLIGDTTITSQPANAILFRDYSDPDSETADIDLRVKYTNRFKTGAIAITKAVAVDSAVLTDSYSFTISFDNVAGIRFEDTYDSQYQVLSDRQIQQTFTLKAGETKTFTGIPAGTEYTIREASPADGSTLQSVTDSLAGITAPAGIGKDTAAISNDKVVSGKITADDSTSVIQTFTFYNMKEKTPDPTPVEPKTTSIKLTKVDSADSDKTLSGAAFRLEKLAADGSVDKSFTPQELTTSGNGVITFSNLSDGTYRLSEIKAPSGYVQLKNPVTIIIKDGKYVLANNGEKTITNNTISFVVKNNKQKTPPKEVPPKETPKKNSNPPAKVFSLPKTGGMGTILYTLIGVACMSGAIVFFYIRKKKKA